MIAPADMRMRPGSEWRQFTLLMRDSLRKLLNAATMARDTDPMQLAIWTTAVVAAPTALYAFGRMVRYSMLRDTDPLIVEQIVLGDRTFFILYSMLVVALLAALTWEALFPDRADQEIVGALPVRPRTLAAARLCASLTMAAGFSLAINLPTATFIAIAGATHPLMGSLPVVLVAHLISSVGGCLFVFLLLLTVRGTVAFCIGTDYADRLATVLQLVAVVALIELFMYLPTILPITIDRMLRAQDATLWLPPAWFVALYSWMVGSTREVLAAQALRAVLLSMAALLIVVPVYLLPARIMSRRALESQSRLRPGRVARAVRAVGLLAPHPHARAIAQFALTSLGRSRRHILVVVSYAGAGVAIAAISLIAARLRVGLIAPAPTQSFLSVPLIMMFFLALGVRAAFRIPSDLDANWPFRVIPPSVVQAASGTQFALFMLAVAPLLLFVVVAAPLAAWPPHTVIAVLAFDFVAGLVLLEAVLYGWTLIPFACNHAPSTETMKSRWLIYLIPLNLFAFRGAAAQAAALETPVGTSMYLVVMIAIGIAIRTARLKRARRERVEFEPPPDQRLEVLNLSEALH